MAFHELPFRPITTTREIVDLRGEYNFGMLASGMSECTSIILLWDFNPASGLYREMRGVHLGGGVMALDPDLGKFGLATRDPSSVRRALFLNVANLATTRFIAISPQMKPSCREYERVQSLHDDYLNRSTMEAIPSDHAYVHRSGEWVRQNHPIRSIIEFNVALAKKYNPGVDGKLAKPAGKGTSCCVIL